MMLFGFQECLQDSVCLSPLNLFEVISLIKTLIGFTGTLYLMLEVSIIGTFITMLIQLDVLRELLLKRLGYGAYFASFFVAIIVQFLQKRVTNLVFIESRTRFMVHHRAPFLHYWYFMMLTSMTKALISYFLRTLKLALRYPMYSLRVDRNAETWSVRDGDAGKNSVFLINFHSYSFYQALLLTVAWYKKGGD